MDMSSALTSPPSTTANLVSGVIESFDATRIAYDLYDLPSRTLVLVIPGFWRFRRHPSMTGLSGRLNTLGYRTAIGDPQGHCDSARGSGFKRHVHNRIPPPPRAPVSRSPAHAL